MGYDMKSEREKRGKRGRETGKKRERGEGDGGR